MEARIISVRQDAEFIHQRSRQQILVGYSKVPVGEIAMRGDGARSNSDTRAEHRHVTPKLVADHSEIRLDLFARSQSEPLCRAGDFLEVISDFTAMRRDFVRQRRIKRRQAKIICCADPQVTLAGEHSRRATRIAVNIVAEEANGVTPRFGT